MPLKKYPIIFKSTEFFAYLIAGWSFLVLFLEPILQHYLNFPVWERITAMANLLMLSVTLISNITKLKDSRRIMIVLADLAMLVAGLVLLADNAQFVIFFLLIRQSYFILQYFILHAFEGRIFKLISENPPVSLMLSFAGVILVGTILLMLPTSSRQGVVTNFVTALFTSTSATCVTGLTVVDTGTYFSLFGQIVILLLIQVGGLGIMTISTAFALILGQRITLKLENVMHNVVGETEVIDVFRLIRSIVMVTAIIESIGALLLFFECSRTLSTAQAIFYSIFHSVSAFCNAGFSLWRDNLMGFIDSPIMNFAITGLIILGGLGFAVLIDVFYYITRHKRVRKLTLHSKLVLTCTAFLLVMGFVGLFYSEYHYSMRGLSMGQRAYGAWFQSVTARTAGFNTVDIGKFGPASVLITLVLMFIGASPGSTGGGIKTTTFSVMVISVISMLRGRRDLTVFNRKINPSNAQEATTLITLATTIILVIVFILLLIEPFSLDKVLFEAISAFGTVGLSMGITSSLTPIGKLLITLLMYIGRIGPLTLIYAVSLSKKQPRISLAEEKIAIG